MDGHKIVWEGDAGKVGRTGRGWFGQVGKRDVVVVGDIVCLSLCVRWLYYVTVVR